MSENERRLIAAIKKTGYKKLTPKCAANKKKNRAKRKLRMQNK